MVGRFLNPVYDGACADPFVLKHRGEYWCYSTGLTADGRCFPILHSLDLVNWQVLPGAMTAMPAVWTEYWAPEVTYDNGRFLMYYSVGDGTQMHIRVAVAQNPAGPFLDSGNRLTTDEFAIDAHVFDDDDGSRYLFYATDFLTHSHVGTGTVYDRMLDPFTLAGNLRRATLACYDWHVFDPERAEKGGVRWHTIEGPFVLKYKGLYYQMFSAGNWKDISYGVSYAITDGIREGEWRQVADGERVLPILRTIPGKVIGPGHNSVVRGPDNQQLFCIYHRWSEDCNVRALAIDRLEWVGDRLIVLGPSSTSQPIPIPPTRADEFRSDHKTGLGEGWSCVGGRWRVSGLEARQESYEPVAEARTEIGAPCFVLEISLRAIYSVPANGAIGVELWDNAGVVLRFSLLSLASQALVGCRADDGVVLEQRLFLPSTFLHDVYHRLRIECNGSTFKAGLEGVVAQFTGRFSGLPIGASLVTREMSAAFSGFAATIGWQDTFCDPLVNPLELGWNADDRNWQISNGELRGVSRTELGTSIFKGSLLDSYELVINVKLSEGFAERARYGIYPAVRPDEPGPLLTITRRVSGGWCISLGTAKLPLPDEFDPFISQQFRIRKGKGLSTIWWESILLGSLRVPDAPTRVGLYAADASVGFDLVRITALRD